MLNIIDKAVNLKNRTTSNSLTYILLTVKEYNS